MQESDGTAFERVFRRLCAGYDTPPTDERKAAYWRSLRKLTLLEFAGLVDMALVESSFASMPTVGAMWDLHRRTQAPQPASAAVMGPTLQEQLMAHVARRLGGAITEVRDGTFVYREWTDTARPKGQQRCAECIGWIGCLPNGDRIAFSVTDMQAPEAFGDAA